MNKESGIEVLIVTLLIVVGIVLRFAFQDLPNVAPTAAFALFAGYRLKHTSLALLIPLVICTVSDLWIGGYHFNVMLAVYCGLSLPVLLGLCYRAVRSDQSGWKPSVSNFAYLTGLAIGSSTLFFLITNFAVWLNSGLSGADAMYSLDFAGLVRCYTNAIPFYRFTLLGDLGFSYATFGTAALALYLLKAKQPTAEAATAS